MANVLCPLATSRIASNSRNLISARRLINPYRCSRYGLRCITASANKLTIQPRSFPTDGFALLPTEAKFEEERLIGYEADRYYPVRLGEVFESKFQVVAKLGFGMSSTVWLCRDLEDDILRTLKVCITGEDRSQELAISHHLKSLFDHDHPGQSHLRIALEDFQVQGPSGLHHRCLVFPALGMSLTQLRDCFDDRALDKGLLQRYLFVILTALDFCIRRESHIRVRCSTLTAERVKLTVNLDLSPNNILVGADASIVAKVEQAEIAEPSPRKVLANRTIHLSYTMPSSFDPPIITDFGAARLGEPGQKYSGDVMPGVFRAPEVVAGMEWDSKIDIWSVGVMIWNLLEDGNLFNPVKDGHFDGELHFAQMISLMGPPPKEFLERSDRCREYWNAEGCWIATTPIPDQTLESREMRLVGKDRGLLLVLMRKILKWLPEERPSAEDLFEDGFVLQFMSEKNPSSL